VSARLQPVGVVLAGGAGRRIGGDKAIVELDGRALLLYPLAVLRSVLAEVAIVAKRDTALPVLDAETSVWLERDHPRHPLCGIVHALRLAAGRSVLVVAGDMPLVDVPLVRALVEAERVATGAAAVVPRAGGRLQPLCALYTPRALPALERFDPDVRAADAVAALDPVELEVVDETPFFNVNAPEDLLQAAALLSQR
jgi:molybdopterin-guanine dinucleotide biosynthesis protein A